MFVTSIRASKLLKLQLLSKFRSRIESDFSGIWSKFRDLVWPEAVIGVSESCNRTDGLEAAEQIRLLVASLSLILPGNVPACAAEDDVAVAKQMRQGQNYPIIQFNCGMSATKSANHVASYQCVRGARPLHPTGNPVILLVREVPTLDDASDRMKLSIRAQVASPAGSVLRKMKQEIKD
eukprot:scaffold275100_cov26-Prasinocladus_malaysianus.AAC.1